MGKTVSDNKIITTDKLEFPLKNWEAVQFVNEGASPVIVFGVELPQKGTLNLGGNGHTTTGFVDIRFKDKRDRKLVCIFETLITDPQKC